MTWSLRRLFVALLLGQAVYLALGTVVVALVVGRSTLRLVRSDQPVLDVLAILAAQQASMDSVERRLRQAAAAPLDAAGYDSLRRFLEEHRPSTVAQLATIPAPLRGGLLPFEATTSRLQQLLHEGIALAQLGRHADVARLLERADTLHHQLTLQAAGAQQTGIRVLLDGQTALTAAARRGTIVLLVWAASGLLVLPVILVLARRRVVVPLRALQDGIERVGAGDIDTTVAARYPDELGRLTDHFNVMTGAMRQRIEKHGRMVAAGELLAAVAHEIKNAIMAITAVTQARTPDGNGHDAEFRTIEQHGRRAGRLAQALLRFVHREAAPAPVVDLRQVVTESLLLVEYQFAVDEIHFTWTAPPHALWVRAELRPLQQIVVNLLSNALAALRAVPAPRCLTVEAGTDGTDGWIAVDDGGTGMSDELAAAAFEPFSSSRRAAGSGLGLYISRRIARGLGGDLIRIARPGPGCRFALRVPCTDAPAAEPAAPEPPAVSAPPAPGRRSLLAGLSILIVDDEVDIRRALGRYLRALGATIQESPDGAHALDLLQRETPDIALVDFRMPGMNGVQLYQAACAARPVLCDRFVFLSGDLGQLADPDVPIAPDRILPKPMDLPELAERLLAISRGNAA